MKYYIGEIETYIGESEITTTVRFRTDSAPDNYLDELASEFWGEAYKHEEGEMYDFGDKHSCGGKWQQVNADTYNALQIIVELSTGEEV